jgi:hypothetical protein
MARWEHRSRGTPSRRLFGALLLALLATQGPSLAAPDSELAAGVSSPPPRARALVPRFNAPEGCRNSTLLDFPSAGFPRVLPLTRFCPFEPRTDCIGEALPSRSRMLIREIDEDPRKDQVHWKLRKGQATSAADVGNPTQSTDYELCVYVEVADVCWLVLHPDALAGAGWRKHKRGYSFKAKPGAHPEGIRKLRIRTGGDRKSRVIVRGKGALLDLRALPIPPSASILVQLYNSEDRCWSTEFGLDPVIDTDRRYKDRSDP